MPPTLVGVSWSAWVLISPVLEESSTMPQVLSGHAAHVGHAGDGGGAGTGNNTAALAVEAHQSADILLAGH